MDPYSKLTRSGEVLSVLVEADSHDPVRCIERLFDAITVMTVYVDVENTRVVPSPKLVSQTGLLVRRTIQGDLRSSRIPNTMSKMNGLDFQVIEKENGHIPFT